MSAALAPHRHIIPAFEILREKADECPGMKPLLDYVDKQWLQSKVWKPMNFNVYKRVVRTNNIVLKVIITD